MILRLDFVSNLIKFSMTNEDNFRKKNNFDVELLSWWLVIILWRRVVCIRRRWSVCILLRRRRVRTCWRGIRARRRIVFFLFGLRRSVCTASVYGARLRRFVWATHRTYVRAAAPVRATHGSYRLKTAVFLRVCVGIMLRVDLTILLH